MSAAAAAGGAEGDSRIPATVLTGFLGSGKTTLLNYILSQDHGLKIAVIENEFGEVGIDDALVRKKYQTEEEIFEMNNGCICCTVRGDLIRILGKILRKKKIDAIIIETTGLADPAPVVQTFFMDEHIKSLARVDSVLTVVDAKHIIQHLDEKKPEGVMNEAVEQIAFADRLLVNKCDLVDEQTLENVSARLREINKEAPQTRSTNSVVPLAEILGIGGFDLERVLTIDPDFLGSTAEEHKHDHDHGHDHACTDDCKHDHKSGVSDHAHQHDSSTTSVGIRQVGELDMEKLNTWMANLLQTRGPDLYRMKGVLAIKGMPHKYVFQGVHMVFDGSPLPNHTWEEGETKENRLIFIGKNLDAEALKSAFQSCLAS